MGPPGAALLRLLPLLLALLDPGSTEDVKVVNALVGGTIDLPLYYSGKATGYIWTKEKNRVTEWDEGLSVTYYDTLRGRCELDTSTGVLTIRDLKEEDSARYKGEALVNNVYRPSNFHLQVFPSLNNPTVTCIVPGGNYTILCDHQPEPKTYMWRSKGLVEGTDYLLTNFNKTLTLTKAKVPFQSLECVVQNPVSEKSAPVPEDCFRDLISKRGENTRGRYGLIPAFILFLISVAFPVYYIWLVGVVVCHGPGNDQPQGDNADCRSEQTKILKGVVVCHGPGNDQPLCDNADCRSEQTKILKGVEVCHGTGNDQPQGDNADYRSEQTEMLKEDESQVMSASDPKEETSEDRDEVE